MVFPPPFDAATISALLEREDALFEQAWNLLQTSMRRRHELERALAELHRLLEQLGYRPSA